MFKKAKLIAIGIVLLISLVPLSALHYALPQVDVVRIVDTEVKRTDVNPKATQVNDDKRANNTSDVYYINAVDKNDKPKVYRNEDNWFYIKVDSANVNTTAQALRSTQDNPVYVAIKHYGWRNEIFSWFPNTLSIKKVDADYTHVPVLNIIVLTVLFGFLFFVYRFVAKTRQRIQDKLEQRNASREQARAQAEAQRNAPKPRDTAAEDWLNEPTSKTDD